MPKKIEDNFSGELIKINPKERGISRCRFRPFSTYCWWILKLHSENLEIFLPKDLCKYGMITYHIAYRFFEDLVNLGYFNKIEYHYELTKNAGEIKLMELLPYIKKTLGLK